MEIFWILGIRTIKNFPRASKRGQGQRLHCRQFQLREDTGFDLGCLRMTLYKMKSNMQCVHKITRNNGQRKLTDCVVLRIAQDIGLCRIFNSSRQLTVQNIGQFKGTEIMSVEIAWTPLALSWRNPRHKERAVSTTGLLRRGMIYLL